jgi:predicted secreted protein
MATFVGNNGVITVGGNNVAEIRSYSIDTTADTIEKSVMGNDTRVYVKGMSTWSGSADVYWDPAHWTSAGLNAAVTGTSQVGSVPVILNIFPEGTGSKWSGEIVITGYSVTGSMDGLIEATVSFQGSGAIAFGS